MSDIQEIVEDAKRLVRLGTAAAKHEVEKTAAAFTTKCRDVNTRLSRCAQYLRYGLHGEAIHLAEVSPKVLESIAVLDFQGQDEWRELIRALGYDSAPPLSLEIAEALNKAYPEYHAIEGLVRKNRLLALARAPVSKRIELLWELAARCPGTFWEEDLKEFQAVRLEEIRREMSQATQERDAATLRSLLTELQSGSWVTPPPKRLVTQVQDAVRRVGQSDARTKLWDLIDPLNEALTAFDVPRARELRDEWNQIIEQSGFQPPFDDAVREVFTWLHQEDEKDSQERAFQTAVAELETALGRSHLTLPDLDRVWLAATRHDHELPRHLESRVRARLGELRARQKLKMFLVVLAAAAGVAAVISPIVWSFIKHERANLVRGIEKQVRPMLDGDDPQFDVAKQLLEAEVQKHPWMARDARMNRIMDDLDEARKRDAELTREFNAALAAGNKAELAAKDPPGFMRAAQLAQNSAKRIKALEDLKREREEKLQQQKQDQLTSFKSRVEELEKRVQQLQRTERRIGKAQEAQQLIQAAQTDLNWLDKDEFRVRKRDRTLDKKAEDLAKSLELQRTNWDRVRRLAESEREITLAVGGFDQLTTYLDRIKSATRNTSDTKREQDFTTVVNELVFWKGHYAWEELARPWRKDVIPVSPTEPQKRVDACDKLVSAAPNTATIAKYRKILEPIACRDLRLGPRKSLIDLFSAPSMTNLSMIHLTTGEKYYFEGTLPKETGKILQAKYIVGFQVDKFLTTEEEESFDVEQIKFKGEAPQCRLGGQVLKLLEKLEANKWDDTLCQIANMVYRDAETDPILKLNLLIGLLERGKAGSYALELACSKFLDDFENAEIETRVEWMDPGIRKDKKVVSAIEATERFLQAHDLSELAGEVREALASVQPDLGTERSWVGWLHRNEDGTGWTCSIPKKPSDTCPLWIIVPQGTQADDWFEVGQWSGAKPTIDSGLGEKILKEGRPVFAPASAMTSQPNEPGR